MNYSKIQRIISAILLISFVFTFVINVQIYPFIKKAQASSGEFYNLVSILVDDEIYPDIKDKVERYAKDIQGVLENTRAVIIPVPKTATPFQIASLNEGLYFDGYKSLKKDVDFNSKLIGTVLIGNLPVPIINNTDSTSLSIAPYVDFIDKAYIYDHKTGRYEKNLYAKDMFKPEIWHGVIYPNTGEDEDNIKEINDFLDKDHDFYTGKNLFKSSSGVLNGDGNEVDKNYKPFVFYYDQFREEKSIHYPNYVGYLAYLKNKEDIVYNRYSKDLVNNILNDVNKATDKEIENTIKEFGSEKIKKALDELKKDNNSFDISPDIAKIPIVKKSIKKFFEVFNKGTIADFRTDVHNAGRYNEKTSKVNVDLIPYLISILDNTTDKLLKSANTDIENYIFGKAYPEAVHLPIPVSIYASEGLPKDIGPLIVQDTGTGSDFDFYFGEGTGTTESTHIKSDLECDFGIKPLDECFPYNILGKDLDVDDIEFLGDDWDSIVKVAGYPVKRHVFAQILNIKGFYANAEGDIKIQLENGANIQLKESVLRKILDNFASKYDNFYNGRAAEYFGGPEGGSPGLPVYCSLYRGSKANSGQVVEMNHGFNYRDIKKDLDVIYQKLWDDKACAYKRNIPFEYLDEREVTRGYWGGSSIMNIAGNNGLNILLKENDPSLAVVDLFDPLGAQRVEDHDGPSIMDCYNYNYLLTYKPVNTDNPDKQAEKQGYTGEMLKQVRPFFEHPFRIPFLLTEDKPLTPTLPVNWDCYTQNQKFNPAVQTEFGRKYVISDLMGRLCEKHPGNIAYNCAGDGDVEYNGNDGVDSAEDCLVNGIELWYTPMGGTHRVLDWVSTYKDDKGNEVYCPVTRYKYHFTSTEGYIKHHSPTDEDLELHMKNPGIPNLPIDRDRYLEIFTGDFLKFKYPYLFRLKIPKDLLKKVVYKKEKDVSYEDSMYFMDVAKKELEKFLEEYDNSNDNAFEVKNYVTSKEDYPLKIGDEEKKVNYFDILAFAIFWNSLDNISSKYKFIVENYLSDELLGNDYKFLLPKSKREYEIAYLGAIGDEKNMYIKVDPEEKNSTNPYVDVINKNNSLSSNIFAFQALSSSNQIAQSDGGITNNGDFGNGTFECAPPEGVPIRKWLPAIKCRLKTMLPPKIGISDGDCGPSLLNDDSLLNDNNVQNEVGLNNEVSDGGGNNDSISSDISSCVNDFNKNGINDCLEKKLDDAELNFYSDMDRYTFGKNGKLYVIVNDKNGKRIYIDNNSKIYFSIEKIIDKNTGNIIFNKNAGDKFDKEKFKEYVNFSPIGVRTKAGKVNYDFSVGYKKADIYFRAILKLKDTKTNQEKEIIKSDLLKIEIRDENLFLLSSNYINGELNLGGDYAIANDTKNVYLYNGNKYLVDSFQTKVNSGSLLIGLLNTTGTGKELDFNFPINLKIVDNNKNIVFESVINDFKEDLLPLLSITKSGEYSLVIKDSKGLGIVKKFSVKPNTPVKLKLNLGTDIVENNGAISTNYVIVYDDFDNPVIGDLFNFSLELDGDSLKFVKNDDKNLEISTVEGFGLFRLKSLESDGVSKLKVRLNLGNDKILKTERNIKVVSGVDADIKLNNKLEVGYKTGVINFKLLDSKGNKINLNSRVYLQIDSKYGHPTKPYFDLKNGEANIEFVTSKLAGENIVFKFQVEGFKKIFIQRFNILPLKPLKVQILPSKTKFEASKTGSTTLNIELKDIYGNIVFNDNSTKLKVEILDEYKSILDVKEKEKTVYKGKASIKVYGTELPGKAYLKISTNPSLDDNFFEVIGQGPFEKTKLKNIPGMLEDGILSDLGKEFFYEFDSDNYRFKFNTKEALKNSIYFGELSNDLQEKLLDFFDQTNFYRINGVGENVIELKTYFFWNKDRIKGKVYNALYTVLLGAAYGDITQKDYLASGILFDKDNRALAVTSLISSPYKFNDILFLDDTGYIKDNISPADLTQSVEYNLVSGDKRPFIDLYNDNLGIDIGKIVFNFEDENNLSVCEDLDNCNVNKEKTSIFGINKYGDYKFKLDGDELVLENSYSDKILSIEKNGKINLYENVTLSLSKEETSYLLFDVEFAGDIIAHIGFNFVNSTIRITRDNIVFNGLLKTLKNSIIIKLNSDNYGVRKVYSKDNIETIGIYYKDPFEKTNALNSFAKGSLDTFDNFINSPGVGWKGGNKTLLSFAAGKNVGDAVKENQSLLEINLGDPVVFLKKVKVKKPKVEGYKKFDRTIGKKLVNFDVEGYRVFDYNNDGKDDILLIKDDGYLALLENEDLNGELINLRNVVNISDVGNLDLIKTGDFTGDGYDDIFFVNDEGEPFLLNNKLKDFSRINLKEQFALDGRIMMDEVFDMDNDGVDDIVVLDDLGSIYIFYGTKLGAEEKPKFDKKEVYSGYGIILNSEPRDDYGLVYFNGVPQISTEGDNLKAIESAEQLNKEMDKGFEKIKEIFAKNDGYPSASEIEQVDNIGKSIADEQLKSGFNEGILSSLIFKQVPYSFTSNLWDNIDLGNKDEELYSVKKEARDSIKDFYEKYKNNINKVELNPTKQLTFIRSQYAKDLGVKIKKIYKDRNGGKLRAGDIVNVKVTIKNNTSHNIKNLIYIDTIPEIFDLVGDSVKNNKDLTWKVPEDFGDILVDGINLGAGETFELDYNLETKSIRVGYIKVGLFEKGEIGDDPYGDIIYKTTRKNCGSTVDIFRSVAKREYVKGEKSPSSLDEIYLPEELSHPDEDKNGIPDYIDELIKDEDGNGKPDYIDESLGEDEDGNGLPDKFEKGAKWEDGNDNGIPDGYELGEGIEEAEMPESLSGKVEELYDKNSGIKDIQADTGDDDLLSSLDRLNNRIDEINEDIDKVLQTWGCGFGGGSCLSLPINWAPLSVGSDPTIFGYLAGDGLSVREGLPLFSALTGIQAVCGHSPCCLPTTWPPSPLGYMPWPHCWLPSAGGRLGARNPNNFFRLFYSPTLTGGQGVAMCFGGPAFVYGYVPPPAIHPLLAGGNCIVVAAPLGACDKDDEDLGNPTTMGVVSYAGGNGNEANDFGTINGNCDGTSNETVNPEKTKIEDNLVSKYLTYKKTGKITDGLLDEFDGVFGKPSTGGSKIGALPTGLTGTPLISISGKSINGGQGGYGKEFDAGDGLMDIEIEADLKALGKGDFKNVVKIKNLRIMPFPDFLMDWATRQMEEIVTKLTDFPTLYIILPDLSGIFNKDWLDYVKNGVKKAYNDGKDTQEEENKKIDDEISNLESQKAGKDCSGKDYGTCKYIDAQIAQLRLSTGFGLNKQVSGISQVFEFISSLPIINIYSEDVEINIPWIDFYTLDKTIKDYKLTLEQRQKELKRFSNEVSGGGTCSGTPAEIEKCEKENSYKNKVILDISRTINSLEKNIQVLEDRKNMPDKIYDLINKKEVRLDQILCNIETISELIGGWIGRNGERFKNWVELYVLIKAILKSWQLFIDIFIDFDVECHYCKNERYDLVYFILKLISMIIPKIPIIKFPKWPDIIVDLHNIRLSLDITIPNFIFNKRPIVLPNLPELRLPNVPTLKIHTPEIPILPTLEIPELPDLPTLPKIELPNLPPPPTLPKLLSAIEAVLKIFKLVAKILCILKKSPLVPEWRAGDQIAFLTERTGYLPIDFLAINLPQFSFSFVDAIKVTTRVNFQQDVDYLTEMVRNIVGPISSFSNNVVNIFNIDLDILDFSDTLPSEIDVGVDKVGYEKSIMNLAFNIALGINKLVNILDKEKNETISNKDFIYKVNKDLNKKEYINDSKFDELRNTWSNLQKISFNKQDKIIKEALENNRKKFGILKDIINNEKSLNKKLKKNIKTILSKNYKKISNDLESNYSSYNELLNKYNLKVRQKALSMINYKGEEKKKLKELGNDLLTRVKGGLNNYVNSANKKLLAESSNNQTTTKDSSYTNGVNYKYSGIYVVEKGGAYKLFDYTDKLTGEEEPTPIDIDNDGDKDLLYLVDNELFIKENLSIKDNKNYLDLDPLEVDIDDNKFFSGDFIEAINGFNEVGVSSDRINFNFLASTDKNINNYRVEFYNRVDKFLHIGEESYIPEKLKKSIIDMFSGGDNLGVVENSTGYTISKNIAYLDYVGLTPGVKLRTNKLVDITNDIRNGVLPSISAGTKLYSGDTKVRIYYLEEEEKKEVEIREFSNISFINPIQIYKIEGGSLYYDTGLKETLKGQNIMEYMKKPLLFGTEITVYDDEKLTESSHITIKYYDDGRQDIDLRKLEYYTIYDLGSSDSRLQSLSIFYPNDYYYSKIYAFSGEVKGTMSRQVLLSPQIEADEFAPELNVNGDIRIPVYQKKIIDFTNLIYENSGIDNVELKIEKLNPPKYKILRSNGELKIEFGKFKYLFKTNIKFVLSDKNGNTTSKDVGFEVYSPIPKIDSYSTGSINGYINEDLTDEPINIYRYREGLFSKMLTFSGTTRTNTKSGAFNFNVGAVDLDSQKVEIKDNNGKILSIDGFKGVVDFAKLGYTKSIVIEDDYPTLIVKDIDNNVIYKQKIIFNNFDKINIVSDFDKIGENYGLYLRLLSDKYSYHINPLDVKYNPGELIIYRKTNPNKTPLFTIFKDGRIKTLNVYYKVEYFNYNGNLVYKLIDRHFNIVVAELLLNIKNYYIKNPEVEGDY